MPEYYKKADFTMHFSLNKEQHPDADNCDREIYRKRKFAYLAPQFRKKFQDTDILYIGVFSEVGCSFDMTVTANKPLKTEKTTKKRASALPSG